MPKNARELQTDGEDILERARSLIDQVLAKGADFSGADDDDAMNDLDDDFADYDAAAQDSDDAEGDDADDDGDVDAEDVHQHAANAADAAHTASQASAEAAQHAANAMDAAQDVSEGDDDEPDEGDLEPDEDDTPAPFAKAGEVSVVDALPILQALDAKLEALPALIAKAEDLAARLEVMQPMLAKAVQYGKTSLQVAKAQTMAGQTFAKAQGAAQNTPRKPKSKVTVPSAAPPVPDVKYDADTILAKADQVVTDVNRMGVIAGYVNLGALDAAVASFSPDERIRAGFGNTGEK